MKRCACVGDYCEHGTVYGMVLYGCVNTINVSSTALTLTLVNSPSSTTRTQPPFEPPLTCKRQDTVSTSVDKQLIYMWPLIGN